MTLNRLNMSGWKKTSHLSHNIPTIDFELLGRCNVRPTYCLFAAGTRGFVSRLVRAVPENQNLAAQEVWHETTIHTQDPRCLQICAA